MVEIEPLRVELEREEDGRVLASLPIETGEEVPAPLKVLFAA